MQLVHIGRLRCIINLKIRLLVMIVKYSKKFPYAPYLNEDIGFEEDRCEVSIDDEEAVLSVLRKMHSIAEKFHKENNPQLKVDPMQRIGPYITNEYAKVSKDQPIPSIDPFAIETLEKMIDDSQTLADLEQLDSKTILDYRLVEHYNARWNDLHEQTRNK